MRRVSLRRQKTNRERQKVVQQQPTLCEARLEGCWYSASDTHEIRTRARGGSITDARNLVSLCRPCHVFLTEHPEWALCHGHMVNSWATQADENQAWLVRSLFKYCTAECDKDHRI